MKIAFAMYTTSLSGGARAVFEIANRLYDRGYNVSIVALGGDHSWFRVRVPMYYIKPPRLLSIIIRMYRLLKFRDFKGVVPYHGVRGFARRLGFYADLVKPLADTLSQLNPDIAIATWYPTALSVWLSNAGKPFFFVQDFPELVQEADGIYGLRMFEAVLRLPFYFLANSSYTKDLILRFNRNARVTIVGAGVDLNTFYPRSTRIVDSSGKPVVMTIIREAKFKGGDIALKALNIINKKLPIHAILVGSRRAIDMLLSEVKPEFTYSVFSNIDDEALAKLYSSSDLFIFTSYRESFGLPPLEAMACGVAVITTDCGGVKDYAIDGYNALIVPPGNPEAVAEASLKVLRDEKLRERLVMNGIETAKQYTWDRVADKFEEAIKSS